MHWVHKTQEKVQDDRGRVQGEEEGEDTSGVRGRVGGGGETKEYWQEGKGKKEGRSGARVRGRGGDGEGGGRIEVGFGEGEEDRGADGQDGGKDREYGEGHR